MVKRSLGDSFTGDFDFNKDVSFFIPEHNNEKGEVCLASGREVILFVAIHRDSDGLQICIQRSYAEGAGGIPTDWWARLA